MTTNNNSNSNNNNNNNNNNKSWFGMMDRLCGCSYADAQLFSEASSGDAHSQVQQDDTVFHQGRSTTVPTSWIRDDSLLFATPQAPMTRKEILPNPITPPGSPHLHQKQQKQQQQQQQQEYQLLLKPPKSKTTNKAQRPSNDWNNKTAPASPTSSFATATTVTMRTRSIASVDTTRSIARQRTSSSLTTQQQQHPQPHHPLSFRRSHTEASIADSQYSNSDHNNNLFHSKVMVSVAFDDDYDDYMEEDDMEEESLPKRSSSSLSTKKKFKSLTTSNSSNYHRPRALRRVQTDSLTQLPALAGYTSAERKSHPHHHHPTTTTTTTTTRMLRP